MSHSILKSSDCNHRIPIPANEGNTDPDYDSLNKVKPWSDVDDQPLPMNDVHQEMQKIHNNLEKMHHKMMSNFPVPPPPTSLPLDPVILPPPLPFPEPIATKMLHVQHRSNSPSLQVALQDSSAGTNRNHQSMPMMLPPSHLSGLELSKMDFRPQHMMIPPPMPPLLPMSIPPPTCTPVITEDEYGNRVMELVLDVTGFMPDDIHINTEGPVLHVHARRLSAKHDVTYTGDIQNARVAKECRRQYTLPYVIKAENLRCYVNQKGQLTIDGALGPNIISRTNKKKVKFVAGRE